MKKLTILTLLFVVLTLMGGCEKAQQGLKIGAILPLSGYTSVLGIPKQNAMNIAAAEINFEAGSNVLSIAYEDSKGNAKDGVSAFQKQLSTTSIQYYYIDLTTIVNACAPIVDQKQVLTFAGSAQPAVTELSPMLFRLFAGGEQEVQMMVDYLLASSISNIYVLHTNEIYGTSAFEYLKRIYSEAGGEILGKDDYPLSAKDVKNILLKAKSSGAEKIVVLGYGIVFPTMLKQMKELEIPTSQVFMNLGATNAQVVALGPDYTDGLSFVGPRFTYLYENDLMTPAVKKFIDAYKSEYGSVPDFRAAYAYDFVRILYDAWSKVGANDLNKVAAEIIKIKDFDGISGKITFRENGDSETDLIYAKYENSRLKMLDD